ncbi:NAD(+) diphosphatase [Neptuniibacter sp. QD48_11]|uniref:NAD(+) diphosphatase n=1 Tax=unclassified Neptuniibacter TaxID=2630693 RepID=UPI0039F58D52
MGLQEKNYFLAFGESLLCDQQGRFLFSEIELESLDVEISFDLPEVSNKSYRVAVLKDRGKCLFVEALDLRLALSQTENEDEFSILSAAAQVITWHASFKFCPRCATELVMDEADLAKVCPSCGHHQYPRLSPCIIVLVRKDDKCLLAHSSKFKSGRYSTLAGFIEAGESAEHAVEREVMEEVGIKVKNIKYVCSQSWPFPHSFMLGFMADYSEGEITPDGEEILRADWFSVDDLPTIPPKFTISRQLIDKFIEEM